MILNDWAVVFTRAFQDMWTGVVNFVPQLIIAIVIFIIGWVLGVALGRAVAQVIRSLKIDHILKSLGAEDVLSRAAECCRSRSYPNCRGRYRRCGLQTCGWFGQSGQYSFRPLYGWRCQVGNLDFCYLGGLGSARHCRRFCADTFHRSRGNARSCWRSRLWPRWQRVSFSLS